MKAAILIVGLFTSSAFASHLCPDAPNVSTMTCAQAQAFVQTNHCYWKEAFDQLLPIKPVRPAYELRCGPKSFPAAMWEPTVDNPQCILGFKCFR